jgi:hypothetical protein
MAKTASVSLHALVHAMTPGERRYFRIRAASFAREGGIGYLRLFDALEVQQQFDDNTPRDVQRDETVSLRKSR